MFQSSAYKHLSKPEFYHALTGDLQALIEGETDWLANAANCAALLYHSLPDINWAGFYFYKNGELVLGPFQGKPACVRIAMGRGVCGTAAGRGETLVVKNVHAFPGHIACDSASNSEIVVPISKDGNLIGVLDVDSPLTERFDEADQNGLEQMIAAFLNGTNVYNIC